MGLEAKFEAGSTADVVDEGGAEDDEAGSAEAADAGIDDPIGFAGKEPLGELLRALVAAGDGFRAKIAGEVVGAGFDGDGEVGDTRVCGLP